MIYHNFFYKINIKIVRQIYIIKSKPTKMPPESPQEIFRSFMIKNGFTDIQYYSVNHMQGQAPNRVKNIIAYLHKLKGQQNQQVVHGNKLIVHMVLLHQQQAKLLLSINQQMVLKEYKEPLAEIYKIQITSPLFSKQFEKNYESQDLFINRMVQATHINFDNIIKQSQRPQYQLITKSILENINFHLPSEARKQSPLNKEFWPTVSHSEACVYFLNYKACITQLNKKIMEEHLQNHSINIATLVFSSNNVCTGCGAKWEHFKNMLQICSMLQNFPYIQQNKQLFRFRNQIYVMHNKQFQGVNKEPFQSHGANSKQIEIHQLGQKQDQERKIFLFRQNSPTQGSINQTRFVSGIDQIYIIPQNKKFTKTECKNLNKKQELYKNNQKQNKAKIQAQQYINLILQDRYTQKDIIKCNQCEGYGQQISNFITTLKTTKPNKRFQWRQNNQVYFLKRTKQAKTLQMYAHRKYLGNICINCSRYIDYQNSFQINNRVILQKLMI